MQSGLCHRPCRAAGGSWAGLSLGLPRLVSTPSAQPVPCAARLGVTCERLSPSSPGLLPPITGRRDSSQILTIHDPALQQINNGLFAQLVLRVGSLSDAPTASFHRCSDYLITRWWQAIFLRNLLRPDTALAPVPKLGIGGRALG